MPGPIAFNVVTYVGYKLKGIRGAFVSMVGILLPSFLLMLLLSFLYLKYGNIPLFTHFFEGILPAVAAIIIAVAITMSKKNISDIPQIIIAILSALIITLSKLYISTIGIMLLSGIAGYILYHKTSEGKQKEQSKIKMIKSRKISLVIPLLITGCVVLVLLFSLIIPWKFEGIVLLHQKIMLVFSGMSLSLFGGGYVVIPAMQKIVVNLMNWLTNKEFADAIAMGQITPGPIFISATFIGYKIAGFWGALNATVAIFLPPGLLMIACSGFFEEIRNSTVISAIFKGLRPAIIGMIAAAAFTIMIQNDPSIKTGLLFCVFLFLSIMYKTDPVYLIPSAGIIGLLIF